MIVPKYKKAIKFLEYTRRFRQQFQQNTKVTDDKRKKSNKLDLNFKLLHFKRLLRKLKTKQQTKRKYHNIQTNKRLAAISLTT